MTGRARQWQGRAGPRECGFSTLAGIADRRHAPDATAPACGVAASSVPYPVLRPGAPSVGPRVWALTQGCARKAAQRNAGGSRRITHALLWPDRTTNVRGSSPCASFFSFPSFCCRLPAACPTRSAVVRPVQAQAICWPKAPTATVSPVRPLAPLPALRLAVSTSGFRPAARAIDLTAAPARHTVPAAALARHTVPAAAPAWQPIPTTATRGTAPRVAVRMSAPLRT
jgi:hypothetical protein